MRIYAAIRWRRRFDNTVFIGITGSHGKSTTTVLLGGMLAKHAATRTAPHNNIPRHIATSILNAKPGEYRYFIKEIAAGQTGPGSLDDGLRIVQPQVGVVTAIGGDHRKAFRTLEATAAEKAKLVHRLPVDGLAVLNGDDPLVRAMGEGCRCRVVYYGSGEDCDLRLVDASSAWPGRLTFAVEYRGEAFDVKTQLIGKHWCVPALAAILTALEVGVPRSACVDAAESMEPLFSRMSVHPAPNGASYILDAYKASFTGIEACLAFLGEASVPRKTVVIGTISDYPGARSPHYRKVARMALAKADRVIFTGQNAMSVGKLAVGEFEDRLFAIGRPKDVVEMLSGDALPGEVIYIKASRADRLVRAFGLSRETRRTSS